MYIQTYWKAIDNLNYESKCFVSTTAVTTRKVLGYLYLSLILFCCFTVVYYSLIFGKLSLIEKKNGSYQKMWRYLNIEGYAGPKHLIITALIGYS